MRVRLHGAQDLKAADDTTRDGKKDMSDPYCTLGLHETEHRGTPCDATDPNPNPNPNPNPKRGTLCHATDPDLGPDQ